MKRILVAEDSATQAQQLEFVLRSDGHDVEVATDGAQALQRAWSERFDLLISDVMMPGLTGLQLCRRIKADDRTRALPVLLLTSLREPNDVLHGLEAGADNYVTKPYAPEDLLARVRRLLAGDCLDARPIPVHVETSFRGQSLQLSLDARQVVGFFLSSFEDNLAARDREREQHIVTEAVQRSLLFFQNALNALSTAVAVFDVEGRLVAANAAWTEHFAVDADATVALREHDQRTRMPELTEAIDALMRGRPANSALRAQPCPSHPGRRCDVRLSHFAIAGEDRLVVAHEDVTTQWQALQRQTARFAITRQLQESPSLAAAAPGVLGSILDGLGCSVAELWLLGDDCLLRREACASAERVGDYRAATNGWQFEVGEDIVGLAVASRATEVFADLGDDARFFRRLPALRYSLGVAIVAPIFAAERDLGALVLLFADDDPVAADTTAEATDIAAQLALFVERRRAEVDLRAYAASLAASERKQRDDARLLRLILDSVSEPILVADVDGTHIIRNRAALETFGLDVTAPLAPLPPYYHPDGRPFAPDELPLRRALKGESVDAVEIRLGLGRGGKETQIVGSSRPLIDEDQSIIGSVAVMRDVSAQRQTQEALHRASKLEAIGRLAGGIAHDFNNYLTAIYSYADLMLSEVEPDSQLEADLGEVRKVTLRATGLTRQLLAFGRRQVASLARVDLVATAQDLNPMLVRLLGPGIELRLHLADEVPNLIADRSHLEQILMNLVVNARDAIDGKGTVTIEVGTATAVAPTRDGAGVGSSARYVRIVVRDDGAGMPPEVQARIFEPFFTTKSRDRGTGLGLATVHGLVEQMHGQISFKSSPGRGTSFSILLPAAEDSDADRHPASGAMPLPGRGELVMLVESDAAILDSSARVLRRLGYRVREAGSAGDALLQLQIAPVELDVLIVSARLHPIDGGELARRVRAQQPGLPVLLTVGDDDASLVDAQAEGFETVAKPYRPDDLAAALRYAIDAAVASARPPTAGSS